MNRGESSLPVPGAPESGSAAKEADEQGFWSGLPAQNRILRACLERMDSAIFSVDCHYRYTSFNGIHAAIMKALYGVEIELGKSLLDYQTVPEDRAAAKLNLDRALSGETVVEAAYSGSDPAAQRYFEVAHHPLRNDQGECTGVVVIAKDVTSQRRALAAQSESERRFQTLFEQAGVGIGEVDSTTGRYLQVNQHYCDIVGYSKEELLEATYQPLTHPEDLAASLELMAELRVGRIQRGTLEKRYIRKDGTLVWVSIQLAKMLLDQPSSPSHISVVQDITARVEMEEALRRSEQGFRTLTENLPFMVARFDRAFRHLYVNPAVEQAAGIPVAAFLGKSNEEIPMPRAYTELWNQMLRNVFATEETQHFEFDFPASAGTEVYSAILVPEKGKQGTIDTALGVAINITAIKRSGKEIKAQLEELRRWHEATLGRESRILELKREVNELSLRQGQPPPYRSALDDEGDEPPAKLTP